MKKTIYAGLLVIGMAVLPNAFAQSSCDLVNEAQAQYNSCTYALGQAQEQLATLKNREAQLIAALREDSNVALNRCRQDLAQKDATLADINRQSMHLARERDDLIGELRRLDHQTRDRVIWECALIDLKYGTATLGTGRTQEEARQMAWNKGDFKNHGDHAACFQRLEGGGQIEGPRSTDDGRGPGPRRG